MSKETIKLIEAIEQLKKENCKLKKSINNLEKELKNINYKLLESEIANKRKLEFICYLAHEFKTPLNAINGFTSLMQEKQLARDIQIKYQNKILKASEHLYQILETTIDMAKAESNKIKLHFEEINPSDIINEVISVLEEKINEKKICLITNLTKTTILTDKKKFRQLIYNLLGNACKFNKYGGKILIKTSCDGEKFFFEIEDTGCGIRKEEQCKIFELFSCPENNTKHNIEGSGIGLSLCKKIINIHGGEIAFKSTPQKGTTFWFFLPQKSQTPGEYMISKCS